MLTQRWKKTDAIRSSTKENKSKVHDLLPVGVLRRKHDIQMRILRCRGGVIRRSISGIRLLQVQIQALPLCGVILGKSCNFSVPPCSCL